jgi:phosphoglycerate dehydrogenase-like enzyme
MVIAFRHSVKFDNTQLHRFLEAIDTLIIALPELPETRGLIGEKELTLLGEGSVLVNVARGNVIDEEALFNALKSKQLTSAGIDVWYEYNPDPDREGKKYPYHFPFHDLEHLAMSPHRGGSPLESLYRWQDIISNVRAFYLNESLQNVVDLKAGY